MGRYQWQVHVSIQGRVRNMQSYRVREAFIMTIGVRTLTQPGIECNCTIQENLGTVTPRAISLSIVFLE